MPIAFLKHVPQSLKIFLSMLATGVLIFLLYDVIQQASEPINAALDHLRTQHTGAGIFFLDIFLLICGIGLGSVGLVYFNSFVFKRKLHKKTLTTEAITAASLSQQAPPPVVNTDDNTSKNHGSAAILTASRVAAAALPKGEIAPHTLALLIATGIGLHNFSEGLAIGQSAAVGAIQLAVVLIIGFGLHNMTEGFGIAGPLTGQRVSWKFIALLGLIGGGPTFLGSVVGIIFHSPEVFILFLALAAGAIIYVVAELLGVAKRFKSPELVMWGLLIGFLLGYVTDLLVTFAGA
ncbi:MAG: zinc permease [Chloroflexi bacterium]|nr:MAG: zinc permease [Chloroflexota bacterium]